MGFLQCQKCGGYYELQHNENPEDFFQMNVYVVET